MDQHSITCDWNGEGMSFTAELKGHKIELDSPPAKGPNPKPLLLVALAGCTGMDVVSLLKKMRVDFRDLKLAVSGTLTETHPKVYSKIEITYILFGGNPDHDKVEKAVRMSEEQYCGVSAMLKKACPIEWKIEYQS